MAWTIGGKRLIVVELADRVHRAPIAVRGGKRRSETTGGTETVMPAAKIMLIRHAEKPNGDGGPGLMPSGVENPRALTLTGWKRANALVGLFNPARRRLAETAAGEAHEPVRFGIGQSAAEADDCAARGGAQSLQSGLSSKVRSLSWSRRSRRPKTRFSFPGSTKRFRRSPLSFAAAQTAFRRGGRVMSTTSSGCSTFRPPAPGVSRRFPNSSCRATPRTLIGLDA